MTENNSPRVGSISWFDLTVKDAPGLRDFYREVVGWGVDALSMGEYDDYCMKEPASGKTVAGVCHARGPNTKLPPQWIIYITVENVDKSIERCKALGGKVIDGPRMSGDKPFCVIQDPAGAVAALVQA